jgi:hypothetical protein
MEVRRSSWDPATSWNFVSKLVPYSTTTSSTSSSSAPAFNLNKLKYRANNTEVRRFQQWLWSKQSTAYKAWFNKNVYSFTYKGTTTFYGDATARLVQETYRHLHAAHPKAGWNQGWVNGVPPKEPGPGLIKFFGGRPYRA